MAVWIVALLLIAGAGAIFWLRRASPQPPAVRPGQEDEAVQRRLNPQLEYLHQNNRFWGVRIEHGGEGNACDAILEHSQRCYDFNEAPPLPLPQCAALRCSCRYIGVDDRRLSPPRRQSHDRRDKIRYEPTREARRRLQDRRKMNKSWTDLTSQ